MPYKDPEKRRQKAREYNARHYAAHREEVLSRTKEWGRANRGRRNSLARAGRITNPGKSAAYQRARYVPGVDAARNEEYRKKNPGKNCAKSMRYYTDKLKARPSWADNESIREVYLQSAWLTAASGIRHEVDHVIPLKHDQVCGLHTPCNLRIITKSENASKGNKWPCPDERQCLPDKRPYNSPTKVLGCVHFT